jgi:hypothetical protein
MKQNEIKNSFRMLKQKAKTFYLQRSFLQRGFLVRLKIDEAYPQGRGDAQGCAARATLQGGYLRPYPISLKEYA